MQPGCCGLASGSDNRDSLAARSMTCAYNRSPGMRPLDREHVLTRSCSSMRMNEVQLATCAAAILVLITIWSYISSIIPVFGQRPRRAGVFQLPLPALPSEPLRSAIRTRKSRRRRSSGMSVHFKVPKGMAPGDGCRRTKGLDLLASGKYLPSDPSVHTGLMLNIDCHKARRNR